MASQTGSRITVVIIFLFFQLILFVFELFFYATRVESTDQTQTKLNTRERRKILLRHGITIFVGVVGIVLASAIFAGESSRLDIERTVRGCFHKLDSDIGGHFIRIAIWAQEGDLLLISLLGAFHCSATGAKEIGAGIAITHVSLATALLVQMGIGTLTSIDAIIGAMILDSQSCALSLQFVAKHMLAARWQVLAIILCQAYGFALLPIFVYRFSQGQFAAGGCSCVSAFWWGQLSDCQTFPSRELGVFWIYYAFRCLMCLHCWFFSLTNTQYFHEAEKNGRLLEGITYAELATLPVPAESTETTQLIGPDQQAQPEGGNDAVQSIKSTQKSETRRSQTKRSSDLDAETPSLKSSTRFRYDTYPSTVSFLFMIYGVFALVSMVAVEVTIQHTRLLSTSSTLSVGQIIAIVVAGATILRGFWFFVRMFIGRGSGLVSPFSWDTTKKLFTRWNFRPSSQLAIRPIGTDSFDFPLSSLNPNFKVGSVLKKDGFSSALFSSTVSNPQLITQRTQQVNYFSLTSSKAENSIFGFEKATGGSRFLDFTIHILEEVSLRHADVRRVLDSVTRDPKVNKYLEQGPLYMVIGVSTAIGLTAKVDGRTRTFDDPVILAYQTLRFRQSFLSKKIKVDFSPLKKNIPRASRATIYYFVIDVLTAVSSSLIAT